MSQAHISTLTFPKSSSIAQIEVNKRRKTATIFYTSNSLKGYTYVIAQGTDIRRLILDMFDAPSIGSFVNQLRKDGTILELEAARAVKMLKALAT